MSIRSKKLVYSLGGSLGAAAVGGLLIATLAGCGDPSHSAEANRDAGAKEASPQQKIEVAVVRPADFTRSVDLPATVEGFLEARLVARLEGHVGEVRVDIGDRVREGDVLAELRVPELTAEVQRRRQLVQKAEADIKSRNAEILQARAELSEQQELLKLRQSQLTRIANIVAGGALEREKEEEARYAVGAVKAAIQRANADIATAEAHVHAAESQLAVARAELEKAQVMDDYRHIRAPFDGLITSRRIHPGDFVKPADTTDAQALFEIVQTDKCRIVVFVPMEQAVHLNEGDEAVLHSIQGNPGAEFRAPISRLAQTFDRNGRMMRAEIDLERAETSSHGGGSGDWIRPGDYGMATVTVEKHHDVPSVPRDAVIESDGRQQVKVIDDSNRVRLRNVTVGVTDEKLAGVSEGLRLGDRVVVKDASRLENEQQLSAAVIRQASF